MDEAAIPYVKNGRYLGHPLIVDRNIEWRDYQVELARSALGASSLVTLPTGLGKTIVAALIVAERLRADPDSSVVLLAPTKPLCQQHQSLMTRVLKIGPGRIDLWTGETPQRDRTTSVPTVLVATPQLMLNELTQGRLNLGKVLTLILDEAHRAVGNYPYVSIAQIYLRQRSGAHIVGFTASPGDPRRLAEISANLNSERLLARTEEDDSVSKYIERTTVHLVPISMPPPMKESRGLLLSELNALLSSQSVGTELRGPRPTFRSITEKMAELRRRAVSEGNYKLLNAVRTLATARRLLLMIERLDLGGPMLFLEFVNSQVERAGRSGSAKSLKQLLASQRVRDAVEFAKLQLSDSSPNPKLTELGRILDDQVVSRGKKAIVFVSYRACAEEVLRFLQNRKSVRASLLVGQRGSGGRGGMTQKEQRQVLETFKGRGQGALVATQVGEEGLDIAGMDVVIFYDNTPSAIRLVQRLGRTARFAPGDAYLLYFSGTSDEKYLWIARRRERSMRALVKSAAAKARSTSPGLSKFLVPQPQRGEGVTIIVDERERGSQVVAELANMGASLRFETLSVGDYILSEDTVAERKTTKDFASSILDGRLFGQMKELRDLIPRPVLLLEGSDLLVQSGIHPNALRGALISVLLDYGVPILQVSSPQEAANYLFHIAQREQIEHKRFPRVRGERKPPTLREEQIYLLSGLPHVERTTAEKLLRKFRSPIGVFSSSISELKEVEGIGNVKATKIRNVLTKETSEEGESLER